MYFTDILPLIGSIIVLSFGVVILISNRKAKINIIFLFISICIAIWLFGTFMMFYNKNNVEAVISWDRFLYLGVVFVPVLLYHFGLELMKKRANPILYLSYFISIFFIFTIRTKYFLDGVFYYKWGVHTHAQIMHSLFLVYFAIVILIWAFQSYRYYKKLTSPLLIQQFKYVALAFVIVLLIGPFAFFPAYGIEIYPFSHISAVFFVIILAYAIVRHRLLDIKFILKDSSIFIISITLIAIFVLLAKFTINIYFVESIFWNDFLIVLFSVALFPYIKKYITNQAGRYSISNHYNSTEIIKKINNKILTTLDINEIGLVVFEALKTAFSPSFIAIIEKRNDNSFKFKIGKNFNIKNKSFYLHQSTLNEILKNKPIVTDEYKNLEEFPDNNVVDFLNSNNIELLQPLIINKKLLGMIFLGSKNSGDSYSMLDLEFLKIISNIITSTLENARLYEDIKNKNTELKQLLKMKSDFLRVVYNQLNSPLSLIQYALNAGEKNEIPFKESLTIAKKGLERMNNTLSDFWVAYELEGDTLNVNIEVTDIETIIRDLITEKENSQLAGKNIKISVNKPSFVITPVLTDRNQINHAISNLLDNSIYYTKAGIIKITFEKFDKSGKSFLKIYIEDSGAGISEENKKLLFQKFSRGPEASLLRPEGSGLGLYVSKKIIEKIGGELKLEYSSPGKGSIFSFTLPFFK